MQQFIALEENEFSNLGRNGLLSPFVINAKLPTICHLPITVEIHNHGKLPTVVIAKLVEMFFIETSFFVERIMKFIAGDAGVASGIQK
jgi:hypothetical protein